MPPGLGQSASCSRRYACFTKEWSVYLARESCRGDEGLSIDETALVLIEREKGGTPPESSWNSFGFLIAFIIVHPPSIDTVHPPSIDTVPHPSIDTFHHASIDTVHRDTLHPGTVHPNTVYPDTVHQVKNDTTCGETEKIEVFILKVDENGMLRDKEGRTRNST
ncbi:hypothetical protein F2Q70_00011998 [Brassica cretica]|uniref:Uncharacterized protein n=1 Tax=Brassica cretica TaxID=69181 RepID=A0A8S9LUC2_BRACR|nr:hypothetical protein F2Q70_00011998 [Brassica cretica]